MKVVDVIEYASFMAFDPIISIKLYNQKLKVQFRKKNIFVYLSFSKVVLNER